MPQGTQNELSESELRDRIEALKAKNEQLRTNTVSRRYLLRAAGVGSLATASLIGASGTAYAQSGTLPASSAPPLTKVVCGQLALTPRSSRLSSAVDGTVAYVIRELSQTSGIEEIGFSSGRFEASDITELGFVSGGDSLSRVGGIGWGT